MKTYELWHSIACSCYTLVEAERDDKHETMEDDAKLLVSFEAEDYESAMAMKHDYLGWEPYRRLTVE